MAISAASAVASSSSAVSETPSSSCLPLRNPQRHCHSPSKVSFSVSPKPKLRLFSKRPQTLSSRSVGVKAQLNKVALDGFTNAAATTEAKSEPHPQEKENQPSTESSPEVLASEGSISQFVSQVSSLVKLVDSKDIVELQLKQLDCEILIRKKEAIAQTQSPGPVVMMQPSPAAVAPTPAAAPPAAPTPALPAPAPASPAAKSAKSSLPPLKCPMAGTFYRSSAPGEPPFVKVGDEVQKGQVLCIIEAMKLMNEIEADQSGTIIEVLAEDGKPVSVDLPLFVIQP